MPLPQQSRRQSSRLPQLEHLEVRTVPAGLPLFEVVYLSSDVAGRLPANAGLDMRYDDSDILRRHDRAE